MNQGNMKSGPARSPSYVRFINRSGKNVDVIWVNHESCGVKYRTLGPGQFVDVNTFVGHPWIFRDSETGDEMRLLSQDKVYYPDAWTEGEGRRIVIITIPVYNLKDRCCQVVKKMVPMERIHQLNTEIPEDLINYLLLPRNNHPGVTNARRQAANNAAAVQQGTNALQQGNGNVQQQANAPQQGNANAQQQANAPQQGNASAQEQANDVQLANLTKQSNSTAQQATTQQADRCNAEQPSNSDSGPQSSSQSLSASTEQGASTSFPSTSNSCIQTKGSAISNKEEQCTSRAENCSTSTDSAPSTCAQNEGRTPDSSDSKNNTLNPIGVGGAETLANAFSDAPNNIHNQLNAGGDHSKSNDNICVNSLVTSGSGDTYVVSSNLSIEDKNSAIDNMKSDNSCVQNRVQSVDSTSNVESNYVAINPRIFDLSNQGSGTDSSDSGPPELLPSNLKRRHNDSTSVLPTSTSEVIECKKSKTDSELQNEVANNCVQIESETALCTSSDKKLDNCESHTGTKLIDNCDRYGPVGSTSDCFVDIYNRPSAGGVQNTSDNNIEPMPSTSNAYNSEPAPSTSSTDVTNIHTSRADDSPEPSTSTARDNTDGCSVGRCRDNMPPNNYVYVEPTMSDEEELEFHYRMISPEHDPVVDDFLNNNNELNNNEINNNY